MNTIITVTGRDLERLLDDLRDLVDYSAKRDLAPRTVRFGIDGDGLKIKVDSYTWSRGYGKVEKATASP